MKPNLTIRANYASVAQPRIAMQGVRAANFCFLMHFYARAYASFCIDLHNSGSDEFRAAIALYRESLPASSFAVLASAFPRSATGSAVELHQDKSRIVYDIEIRHTA
jgi:hypothetical protein